MVPSISTKWQIWRGLQPLYSPVPFLGVLNNFVNRVPLKTHLANGRKRQGDERMPASTTLMIPQAHRGGHHHLPDLQSLIDHAQPARSRVLPPEVGHGLVSIRQLRLRQDPAIRITKEDIQTSRDRPVDRPISDPNNLHLRLHLHEVIPWDRGDHLWSNLVE